jgi:hypothetical protein
VNCDWCFRKDQTENRAEFIAVTGTLSDMRMTDWVICTNHANMLCNKKENYPLCIADIWIDEWAIDFITDTVIKYYA